MAPDRLVQKLSMPFARRWGCGTETEALQSLPLSDPEMETRWDGAQFERASEFPNKLQWSVVDIIMFSEYVREGHVCEERGTQCPIRMSPKESRGALRK